MKIPRQVGMNVSWSRRSQQTGLSNYLYGNCKPLNGVIFSLRLSEQSVAEDKQTTRGCKMLPPILAETKEDDRWNRASRLSCIPWHLRIVTGRRSSLLRTGR